MPGQYRWGVERLEELIAPLVAQGLRAVLIFGVLSATNHLKDKIGMCRRVQPVYMGSAPLLALVCFVLHVHVRLSFLYARVFQAHVPLCPTVLRPRL